ncbi:MAG: hypothetical protein KAR00_01445, partial [Candidatus Pacebacteria bacterium]|nr:hypothetical protein [Candidatus Paceibacterota bacterium]
MPNIKIKSKTEIKPPFAEATEGRSGWKFVVSIDETEFEVEVEEEYWQKLTQGKEMSACTELTEVKKLVKRSFDFLLARESKESILKKFDLSAIQKYFPEYESEI